MLAFKSARLKPFRTAGVAMVVLALTAAAPRSALHAAKVAGITFDVSMNTGMQSGPMNGGGGLSVLMHGIASADGSTRMDIAEVTLPAGMPGAAPYAIGDYFITNNGSYVLVHPASKTYADVLDQSMAAMNNLPPQVLQQMTITDIKAATETVAGSDAIEGRPTTHYRMTVSYAMSMMGQAIPTTVISDYWVAKLPVKFANPFASSARQMNATGPMAELIKKQIEIAPDIKDGVAVKMTMSVSANMMGQTIGSTMSNEIKNVKAGDVDASKFTLPAGYTKAAK